MYDTNWSSGISSISFQEFKSLVITFLIATVIDEDVDVTDTTFLTSQSICYSNDLAAYNCNT